MVNFNSFRYLRNKFLNFFNNQIFNYPTPSSLNYFWSYGFLALVFLLIQIVTGVLLAMYYIPTADLAFDSVQHIMRDVQFGWFIRYAHSTGSSFFFMIVYLHIARGLYYMSYTYPRDYVWLSGVFIFFLMILTAFFGYVLPWGQMSFWAATVITNLCSAIPLIGDSLTRWLWGGFSVSDPTLKRFFALHYLLPFVILLFVVIHLILLHEAGSSTPYFFGHLGHTTFYPYYFLKDMAALFFLLLIFFFCIGYCPQSFIHPDNNIPANPMVTPSHIVPEWYFLPFYAMLRAVPDKLLGVICMVTAILVLFLLPFISNSSVFFGSFLKPAYRVLTIFFVLDFILLGWLGAKTVDYPYVEMSRYATSFYFFYMFFIPLYCFLEAKIFVKIYHFGGFYPFFDNVAKEIDSFIALAVLNIKQAWKSFESFLDELRIIIRKYPLRIFMLYMFVISVPYLFLRFFPYYYWVAIHFFDTYAEFFIFLFSSLYFLYIIFDNVAKEIDSFIALAVLNIKQAWKSFESFLDELRIIIRKYPLRIFMLYMFVIISVPYLFLRFSIPSYYWMHVDFFDMHLKLFVSIVPSFCLLYIIFDNVAKEIDSFIALAVLNIKQAWKSFESFLDELRIIIRKYPLRIFMLYMFVISVPYLFLRFFPYYYWTYLGFFEVYAEFVTLLFSSFCFLYVLSRKD